jgi:hypothetical protein
VGEGANTSYDGMVMGLKKTTGYQDMNSMIVKPSTFGWLERIGFNICSSFTFACQLVAFPQGVFDAPMLAHIICINFFLCSLVFILVLTERESVRMFLIYAYLLRASYFGHIHPYNL